MTNFWPDVSGTLPTLRRDPRRDQFARGMKLANVPGGKSDFVVIDGVNVVKVNSIQGVYQLPADSVPQSSRKAYSGAVNHRKFKVITALMVAAGSLPASIHAPDQRSIDQFGNFIYPFTGTGSI